MKIAKAVGVLLVCLIMAGCSLIQVNNDRVTVAVVNGEVINLTEYLEYAGVLIRDNEIDVTVLTDSQKEVMTNQILDVLVNVTIQEQKLLEYGLPISDEDLAQATQEIEDAMQSQYDQLVAAYQDDEEVENPELKARQVLDAAYAEQGFNKEMAILERMETNRLNRLYEYITSDITIVDEEVVAYFDDLVAQQKATYQNDLGQYRTDVQNGLTAYYIPGGFFNVKHILIALDDDSANQIYNLRSAGDDEAADALRDEMLATIQDRADEVLAKVNSGGDFDTLIEEYGEDDGMKEEPYNETGYTTYPGNEEFVTEFQEAAEALAADGDVSGLVATDYGYHILKRVSSTPEDTVSFDELDKDSITAQALGSRKQAHYQELLAEWIDAAEIKLYPKRVVY